MNFFSKNKKAIASVAAAAVLGTGVAVYFGTGDAPVDEEIDWSLIKLDVPTIDVPTINVPTLDIATLNVASLDIPAIDPVSVATPQIVKFDKNGIPYIAIDKPTGTVITTETADVDKIEVDLLDTSTVKNPNVAVIPLVKPDGPDNITVTVDKLTIADLNINSLETPLLINLILNNLIDLNIDRIDMKSFDLSEWMTFRKLVKEAFADKRMLVYDKSINITNKNILDWLTVYSEYKDAAPTEYVAVEPFRMITEVRPMLTVKHKETLDINLKHYSEAGYDSVLVTFYPDDDITSIINTIRYIKANYNMKVWLAYSGIESLNTSVFCSVDFYKAVLQSAALYIDGYFNSWRRTSGHLWEQDAPFKAFTNSLLRSVNPKLPIMGELYFGNYWKHDGNRDLGFVENRSQNESAVCVMNFGYSNVNIFSLVNGIIKPYIRSTPLVGCVVGHKAYYASRNKNGLSAEQNIMWKVSVEQDFLDAGFIGTVTFQDDGDSTTTNNLCETLYNEVTGK